MLLFSFFLFILSFFFSGAQLSIPFLGGERRTSHAGVGDAREREREREGWAAGGIPGVFL